MGMDDACFEFSFGVMDLPMQKQFIVSPTFQDFAIRDFWT